MAGPVVVIACLFTAVLGLWLLLTDSRYFNTNLYFRNRSRVQTKSADRPVPALVVTARFLDEALLGLSSEPFVYANVATRIREVLRLPGERRLRDFLRRSGERKVQPARARIGFEEDEAEGFSAPVVWLLRRLTDLGSRAVPDRPGPLAEIRCPADPDPDGARRPEWRGLWNSCRRAARRRVAVLDRLDLADVFDETYLDVTYSALSRLAGPGRPVAGAAADQAERYAFLRSDEALAQRRRAEEASGSGPWAALASSFDDLYKRYVASFRLEPVAVRAVPMLQRNEFEAQTARAWFTMLERLKEVSGAIELNHSLYQSNSEVIDAVATFLTGGAVRRHLPADYQ